MNEIDLSQNIKKSFDLARDLEREEGNIIFATNNSTLNKFYFNAGRKDYFKSVFNELKNIEQVFIENKNIIDPIIYENIMKNLDKLISSVEITISSIDKIIDDYSNYREIDFTNLKNSFYQSKINSDIYLKSIENINSMNKAPLEENKKENQSESIIKTPLTKEEEAILLKANLIEEKYLGYYFKEGLSEACIKFLETNRIDKTNEINLLEKENNKEKNNDEIKQEKEMPKLTVEQLMENIKYSSLENYNKKLMDFRVKHEIDLINKQIMVLENSAKIKDLITLEQLKSEKDSLEKFLEEYNNKKAGIIVSREDLIKKNDFAIDSMQQNINELNSNKYESKLFNSVNNLKIFVSTSYMNKLNKSKQKLIVDQRNAVINKFNGKYANISKLARIKGTVKGTIDKLKYMKNQLIEEVNSITNDIENVSVKARI